MLIPTLIILFILGLFFGSFLNVVADRTVAGESFVKGRSRCDNCKRDLGVKDLVPVLSYIYYHGKCRTCGVKLSAWYPISEILTGLLFSGAFLVTGKIDYTLLYIITIFCFYVVLFLADAKYMSVPTHVIYPAIIVAFAGLSLFTLAHYFQTKNEILDNVLGKYLAEAGYLSSQLSFIVNQYIYRLGSALGIALFFWLLVVLTKGRGMGEGDIYLGFFAGLVSPFPQNVLGIFLAFIFGSLYSIPLLLLKKKSMKSAIPFGPFILLGSLAVLFFGDLLLSLYLKA